MPIRPVAALVLALATSGCAGLSASWRERASDPRERAPDTVSIACGSPLSPGEPGGHGERPKEAVQSAIAILSLEDGREEGDLVGSMFDGASRSAPIDLYLVSDPALGEILLGDVVGILSTWGDVLGPEDEGVGDADYFLDLVIEDAWVESRRGAGDRTPIEATFAFGGVLVQAATGETLWERSFRGAHSTTASGALARDHEEELSLAYCGALREFRRAVALALAPSGGAHEPPAYPGGLPGGASW